jgi:hypothetical protein
MDASHMLWLRIDGLECDSNSYGVKIKPPTMKVDSVLVVISVRIAGSRAFHFLNFAIDAFPQGVCYSVSGIGYDIVDMRFYDRGQPGVRGTKIPVGEVFLHPTFPLIVPEVTEVILDSACTIHLEIQ